MQDKDKTLSLYRLSLSKETLENAKLCLDNHFIGTASIAPIMLHFMQ